AARNPGAGECRKALTARIEAADVALIAAAGRGAHIPGPDASPPAVRRRGSPSRPGLPGPAGAQGYLGLDATLSSPYVWRGVTRANGWVAQPEGFVSVKAGGGFLAAGAWASYELGRAGPFRVVLVARGGLPGVTGGR